jgi:hypothetical protein
VGCYGEDCPCCFYTINYRVIWRLTSQKRTTTFQNLLPIGFSQSERLKMMRASLNDNFWYDGAFPESHRQCGS